MATARTITNALKTKVLPDIFYEDPEPVEDGMHQAPIIVEIAYMLTAFFRNVSDVFVSAGGFIFYDRANGNRRIAPDLYIAFGVDSQAIWDNLPNYWIWEVGKAPDFALEVASPSTAANDIGRKRDLYAELGIAEYWLFDPTGGDLYGQPLLGLRLLDGEYHPIEIYHAVDGTIWSYSEILDLRFHWGADLLGNFDVRDPRTGMTIHMEVVEREARLAAETEADIEREARLAAETEADIEREARLAIEAEATRLREQLRRLQEQD